MDHGGRPQNIVEAKKIFRQRYQQFLDRIVAFPIPRWSVFAFLLVLFYLRILILEEFYVVAYGLSVHLLYLLVLVITPQSDPEEALHADAHLPMSEREHKPFVPKVAEFVVWQSMMKVTLIAYVLTTVGLFDIPVFWPILVLYFFVLFGLQVGTRVQHMVKYKYVPWNAPKKQFVAKDDK